MPGAIFRQRHVLCHDSGAATQLTVLGGMEVASNGDIANWKIPGKMVKGMGGDGPGGPAENIIVAMQHTNRAGASKLLDSCRSRSRAGA